MGTELGHGLGNTGRQRSGPGERERGQPEGPTERTKKAA
jgi:hypothetical protein